MSLMGKGNKVDPLTQLLNYEEFRKKLESDIKESDTEELVVMEVDIDEFHSGSLSCTAVPLGIKFKEW